MTKNSGGGLIFDGLCGLHRSPSEVETLVTWSSAAPLPRRPASVGFRQQYGGQMARASHSLRDERGERTEKLRERGRDA